MSLYLYKFGWLDEEKAAEIEVIREFLGKDSQTTHAEALHALLLGEVNRERYPQDSDLSIDDNRLKLSQYAEKEYYHDGSEQARKYVDIQRIDQEAYVKALESSTTPEPDRHNFRKEWLTCGEDRIFKVQGFLSDDILLYVKNFFGIPYVKISIFYAI